MLCSMPMHECSVDHVRREAAARDDELKVRLGRYNDGKAALAALRRKEDGSLLVRPLAQYINRSGGRGDDIINGEYLKTLLLVVPVRHAILCRRDIRVAYLLRSILTGTIILDHNLHPAFQRE